MNHKRGAHTGAEVGRVLRQVSAGLGVRDLGALVKKIIERDRAVIRVLQRQSRGERLDSDVILPSDHHGRLLVLIHKERVRSLFVRELGSDQTLLGEGRRLERRFRDKVNSLKSRRGESFRNFLYDFASRRVGELRAERIARDIARETHAGAYNDVVLGAGFIIPCHI